MNSFGVATLELVVVFSLFFLALVACLGKLLFIMLNHFLHFNDYLEFFERINLYLFLGTILIPLIVTFWSTLGHLVNTLTLSLTLFSLFTILIISIKRKTYVKYRKNLDLKQNLTLSFLLKNALFTASLFYYLYPTIGLCVYPGNDALAYSFVALRILQEGGHTFITNYGYSRFGQASPSFHFLLIGFPMIISFFNLITSLPIGLLVLLIIQLYRGLTPISIYCFIKRLSGKEVIGITSAFAISFLSWSQIDYFSWGGVGESVAYFLAPTIVYLIMNIYRQQRYSFSNLIFVSSLIAIETTMHLYGTILVISLIMFFIINHSLSKRSLKPIIYFFIIVICSITLLFPLFLSYSKVLSMIIGKNTQEVIFKLLNSSGNDYSKNWRWRILPVRLDKSPLSFFDNIRAIFRRYIGETVTFLGFFSIILLFLKRDLNSKYIIFSIIFLFALAENSPFGLYFIQYPLSYQIFPTRIYLMSGIPISCLAGYGIWGLAQLIKYVFSHVENIRIIVKGARISIPIDIFDPKVIMLIILTLSTIVTVPMNCEHLLEKRNLAKVTPYDLEAFKWIIENTNKDDLFFVRYDYDAGAWIPIYTERKIIPASSIRQCGSLPEETNLIFKRLVEEGIIDNETIMLFQNYYIKYVYIGSKTRGKVKLTFDLLSESDFFELIYENDFVTIFKFTSIQQKNFGESW